MQEMHYVMLLLSCSVTGMLSTMLAIISSHVFGVSWTQHVQSFTGMLVLVGLSPALNSSQQSDVLYGG